MCSHQLGAARQIRNLGQVRRVMLPSENPPQMAVDEALAAGRMDVLLGIRMQVVMPVLGSPHMTRSARESRSQSGFNSICQLTVYLGIHYLANRAS